MILSYRVPAEHGGRKVQSVLRKDMHLCAALVRRLKLVHGIFVNDVPVSTNYILNAGDTVTADVTMAEQPSDLVPQSGPLEIIFENDGILAVNKPSGIITHPSRTQYTDTLANYVSGYLDNKYGDGRCHAVNRLDRGTSGIVLFAKNSYMMERCAATLREENAQKEYLAVVYGVFDDPDGVVNMPISRPDPRDIRREAGPEGQNAVTRYKTLATGTLNGEPVSVLSLILDTGRTHQIRVHCLHTGHPVLGDGIYHTVQSKLLSDSLGLSSQALHAGKLIFTEPVENMHLTLNADINRPEMRRLLDLLLQK